MPQVSPTRPCEHVRMLPNRKNRPVRCEVDWIVAVHEKDLGWSVRQISRRLGVAIRPIHRIGLGSLEGRARRFRRPCKNARRDGDRA